MNDIPTFPVTPAKPTPIVSPIVALLKSRKTIVTIVALLINLLIAAVPDIAPLREELMTIVTGLALGLVGTIAWEDSARAARESVAEVIDVSDEELIKELLGDAVDTIFENANGQTVITLKPGASVPTTFE